MSKNHEGETAMNEQENKAKQLFKESASAKEAAKNAWKFSMDDSLSNREKLHQLGALIKGEAATAATYKEESCCGPAATDSQGARADAKRGRRQNRHQHGHAVRL